MGDGVEERLDPLLQAGFEAHIAACASCRTYFEHLLLTRDALRHLPADETSSAATDELIQRFKDSFRKH